MTPILRRPAAYRQSLIAAFDSCPLRARFIMEDSRRTPGALAARGSLLHRALHRAVREMWTYTERTMSVEQGMELLTDVLCQHDVPSDEVVPLTMREMRWCRVQMTKWCESTSLDPVRIYATEKRLDADITLPLPSGEVVTLTGQMDLILTDPPEGMVVVDYKTGYRRPKSLRAKTPEALAAAEEEGRGLTELGWVQNLIYSYLLFENFPSIQYVIFREVHVLWGEERQARTQRWQMERLKDVLADQVALLHQAIEEGQHSPRWIPSGGSHCALCPRPWDCPIMELEGLDLGSEEGRRRVAHEWIVADEAKNRRREILNGLVDVHGPIEVRHSEGRRVVGWQYFEDSSRRFGVFEPRDIPVSPYDDALAAATREAGVLTE